MRTFNFALLAVISCIAMIGATPIAYCPPDCEEEYVVKQLKVLTILKKKTFFRPSCYKNMPHCAP